MIELKTSIRSLRLRKQLIVESIPSTQMDSRKFFIIKIFIAVAFISVFSLTTVSASSEAVRTVAHNYPSTMFSCWKQVSSVVHGFLCFTGDVSAGLWKNNTGYAGGHSWEKVIAAAIKSNVDKNQVKAAIKAQQDQQIDNAFLFD